MMKTRFSFVFLSLVLGVFASGLSFAELTKEQKKGFHQMLFYRGLTRDAFIPDHRFIKVDRTHTCDKARYAVNLETLDSDYYLSDAKKVPVIDHFTALGNPRYRAIFMVNANLKEAVENFSQGNLKAAAKNLDAIATVCPAKTAANASSEHDLRDSKFTSNASSDFKEKFSEKSQSISPK